MSRHIRFTTIFAIAIAAAICVSRYEIKRVASANDDLLPKPDFDDPGILPPSFNLPPTPVSVQSVKLLRLDGINERAPTSRLSAADEQYVIDESIHDQDFRVRIAAIPTLRYLANRERAIDAAIACTHDRDSEISGDGNVPLYAVTALAEMHAERAIPQVVDWLNFMKSKRPYPIVNDLIINKGTQDLAALRCATTQRAPSR